MKHTFTSLRWNIALLAFVLFANFQCPRDTNGEPLNRIEFNFTDTQDSTFNQKFVAFDTNGDWLLDSIQTIALPANSTLNCEILLFKDFDRRLRNVTLEIDDEKSSHEFQYTFDGVGLSIDSLNLDDASLVYGRKAIWATTANGSGTVRVVLLHEPTWKTSSDMGLIDFDLFIPVRIQ